MGDLGERAFRTPHRYGGEGAEALGPARDELGGIVVAAPRQRPRGGLLAEADAGLRQRGERDHDAARVHQFERGWAPVKLFPMADSWRQTASR
jgi:hypothetical protein